MLVKRVVQIVLLSTALTIAPLVGSAAIDTRPAGLASANAAQARAEKYVVTDRYSAYRMAWVPKFNLCLGVYVTGKMRADKYVESAEGGAWVRLINPRIVNPSMTITTKKSCDDNAEVKRYHRANTVRYFSYFYGHSCSFNPSFSASIPWTIGATITPDCGEMKVAQLGDVQQNARDASRFVLATSGRAFGWKAQTSHTAPVSLKLCTSAFAYFVLRDTEGSSRAKTIKKVRFPDPCVRS